MIASGAMAGRRWSVAEPEDSRGGVAVYGANLEAVVAYILKGTCPDAARELDLERLEAGGRIIGKRAATSQNIGRAARSRLLE